MKILTILFLFGVPLNLLAADHLLAISHEFVVSKKMTVVQPDGTPVYAYTPPGSFYENTPNFVQALPTHQTFFVTCPNGDEEWGGHTGGTVETFHYSLNPLTVSHRTTLTTGNRPFHIYPTPDEQICVTNDGDGTISLIDPTTLEVTTFPGGHDHGTVGFVSTEEGYDLFVTRFHGAESGGVDIIDGRTRLIRTTLSNLLPQPHSMVYSSVTQRMYIACAGGIEVIGTAGAEKDLHLDTLPTTEGRMTPLLRVSPDGRYLIGNCHWDGEPGSYFYAIDLLTEERKTMASVSCKSFAYSPDGNWIVAGDYNKPGDQEIQRVHIINSNPTSEHYMTVVKEISLSIPSQVGAFAQAFSPDSRTAYLGLTQTDQIMVIDVSTLTATTFGCEPAPVFLNVLPLSETTPVHHWIQY
jgi:DNA-binding beta-propeller fold protein YncE